MSSMGGSSNSGPTKQQQQLETQQAVTNANLNIEENSQRKAILNSMQGTRVFRGSALSRSLAGNDAGLPAPGPSQAQVGVGRGDFGPFGRNQKSLFDLGSGATAAGGAGISGAVVPTGGYAGGTGGGGARGGQRGPIP